MTRKEPQPAQQLSRSERKASLATPVNPDSAAVPSPREIFDVIQHAVDHGRVIDRLQNARLATQRNRLGHVINTSGDRDELIALYDHLDDIHRARVLLSAVMGEELSIFEHDNNGGRPPLGSAYAIRKLLLEEGAVMDARRGILSPYLRDVSLVWSPFGDYLVTKNEGGGLRVSRSAHVGSVISVDFDSPLAMRRDMASGVLSQDPINMTESERDAARAILEKGLTLVDIAIPIFGTLIRQFTHRIIIRKSLSNVAAATAGQSIFASEHMTRQVGAIRMLNVHLPEFSPLAAAERLLHESVHNYLASCEYVHGSFCERGVEVRPISPWSGNPIPTSSFIHAVFVYLACYKLFCSILGRPDLLDSADVEVARRSAVHFASGFMVSENLSALLPPMDRAVSRTLLDRVDSVQAYIRQSVKARWAIQ